MGTKEKLAASNQYKTQLQTAGYDPSVWKNPGSGYGNFIDSTEYARITQGPPTGVTSNIPTLNDLAGQTYQFDPNKYLPGIQQTAGSIYDPQRAQIQALQGLQTSQTEQARIRTKEDFAARLEQEKEAINARGAFFGGGALNRESKVGRDQTYALNDINFQDQAAQAGMLAQQAGLSAAQAEYIQQKLSGADNSEYSKFTDQRNFMLGLTQEQRREMESDRQFNEDVRQFGLNYALEKRRVKISEQAAH